MTDAEKQEASIAMSQRIPTIPALEQIIEDLKRELKESEERLASPELKASLVEFKGEVQKFSEGLIGSIDKLLARIEDPKSGAICGKRLQDLIATGNFGYVNASITEANFPDPPAGRQVSSQTDFKVYDFKKTISSDHAVAQMAKEGYRPANLRELLNWMSPNWNGKDLVVALGQEWRDSLGDRHVPSLYFVGSRKLSLDWCDGLDWDSDCRFLAVRNS